MIWKKLLNKEYIVPKENRATKSMPECSFYEDIHIHI